MGKPERSLITKHMNTQARFTHERQSFECLCEKRGAWASPNAPLLQDTKTHKQGLHTGDTISNAFVKGEVHGQAQTLPCHKSHGHISNVYTRETIFRMPL